MEELIISYEMINFIKALKDLAFDVEKAPSMQQTSVNTTMNVQWDEPLTWEYRDIEKRMYERDIKEETFINYILQCEATIALQNYVSPEFAEEIDNLPGRDKLLYKMMTDQIRHMVCVLNYYLVTRNYNLIAVPENEMMLHLTSPVKRKHKDSKGNTISTWVIEIIGKIKINIVNYNNAEDVVASWSQQIVL